MPADQRLSQYRPDGFAPSAGLSHEALVYATDQEFLAGALPLLAAAAERGEPALAVVPGSRAELLWAALGDAVEYADSALWCAIPGWTLGALDRYLRRDRPGGARLWLLAEPGWDTGDPQRTAEWQRLESVLNVVFASAPVSLVCSYDSSALPPEIVAEAGATHPALTAHGRSALSAGFVDPSGYQAPDPGQPAPPPGAQALDFGVSALGPVRRTAHDWARSEGLDDLQARDLLIAVHEVVSNAVEHGGGTGTAQLWASPESLFCEVTSPMRLGVEFPGYVPPELGQPRGRGLWMARQICTHVGVEDGPDGVRVRLEFSRALTAPGPL
jgi:hypothetical protein